MCNDRQAAKQLRYQAKCFQIRCIYVTQQVFLHVFLLLFIYIKTNCIGLYPACNDFIDAVKRTAADEKNILRINFYQLLLRVFTTSLWWHQYIRAFEQFQHSLLHTFTTYI